MSEPQTPEERYEAELPNVDTYSASVCLDALRAMIASLDAELARLTVIVNTHAALFDAAIRDAPTIPFAAPDTVAVPASLVAALDAVRPHCGNTGPNIWYDLAREYDAWKAGQG